MSINCILFKSIVNFVIFFCLIQSYFENLWSTDKLSELSGEENNAYFWLQFVDLMKSLYSFPIQAVDI